MKKNIDKIIAMSFIVILGTGAISLMLFFAYDFIKLCHPIAGTFEIILAIICADLTYVGYKAIKESM